MRKCIPIVLAVAAVIFVCKKSNVVSYAGTLWAQAEKEVKEQIPTRLEIDRVRYEIANLDGDLGKMIRPIAERTAAVKKLKKDIQATQADVDARRETLLKITKDLECNPSKVEYCGKVYSVDRIRRRLERDFSSFKRLDTKLQSQRKLLEAKETALQAAQDQLAKVTAKKHEYELRLAQLEAEEEALQLARMGTPFKLDDSRASQIEAALADIEHRHNVQRAEIELKSSPLVNDAIRVAPPKESATDVSSIRRYLENP